MTRPIYPLLLAPLAVLTLEAANISQVSISAGLRLAASSLAVAAILWVLLVRPLGRNTAAACVGIPALAFWFFDMPAVLWTLLVLGVVQAVVAHYDVTTMTRWMNWTAAIASSSALAIILITGVPRDLIRSKAARSIGAQGPDIYLIILDSYGGRSTLLERFGYDNQPFLDDLQRLGFSAGECKQPASGTQASLGATLNRGDVSGPIRNSIIQTTLEARGYQTMAFATGFVWTEIRDASTFLEPPLAMTDLSEFELSLLIHTPLGKLLDAPSLYGARYRDRTAYVLATLPELASRPEADFVFAHLIIPHPPFVFNADGSDRDWYELRFPAFDSAAGIPEYSPEAYADGYTTQLAYINQAIIPVLATIITQSPQPPVILLMGDHGPWYALDDRNARTSLCAVFAPGQALPLRAVDAFKILVEP